MSSCTISHYAPTGELACEAVGVQGLSSSVDLYLEDRKVENAPGSVRGLLGNWRSYRDAVGTLKEWDPCRSRPTDSNYGLTSNVST